MTRELVFGLRIDTLTRAESLRSITEGIEAGQRCRHVVVNVPKALQAQDNIALRDAINSATLCNADGTWIAVGARLCGIRIPERFTGFDLMQDLVAWAASSGRKVFFFGATDEVLAGMSAAYLEKHPTLEIAGRRNGYFTDDENQSIVAEIAASGADLVFLGFPTPRKELWLAEHFSDLRVPFAMGVGGSFDVVAGVATRAPNWVQRAGMEWLWRLVQEPRRMWRRYLGSAPGFVRLIRDERRRRRAQSNSAE